PVSLGPTDVDVVRRPDGAILLRSPHPLGPFPPRITDRLDHFAACDPDRVLLAQRGGTGWRTLSYGAARAGARRIAQALLARGLSAERPVAVLSGNDLEHALIELGALYAGIPYAPISPAYSLVSSDHGKLRSSLALLTPGLVYASDRAAFARAIAAAAPAGIEVCSADEFDRLLAAPPSRAVDDAHDAVTGDTIAKFLFTSGSTGAPKAVINTQRMWCANQEMLRTMLAYFRDEPPVIVDWAPWHHTAAGNHDFGLVLYNGGTYYIDDGRPVPGAIEATVRNLGEISPTWYFNVPRGFEALLPFLRADAGLRQTFFRRLKVLWFAGAGLAQPVFDAYRELGRSTVGEEILFLTGLGSTETAPYALGRMWPTDDASNIGLPPPGVEVKLVPTEGKYEARLRGPNITPGYWRQPELTREAFDDEGYYRLGDTFAFADGDPARGLLFRGRMSEDFKLSTGTWVHVGPLRARLLGHLAPLVQDVVIAGEGRSELAILVFPAAGFSPDAFEDRLARFESTGSSDRIAGARVLTEPPSLDAGEITDKGTINQRAVLTRRRHLVDQLYGELRPGR
ncbi:MAG TPA: feruloyl-CoA synthase, partial [Kofleriaceae bacterium]|nr:feruloyl-CoA synthase [Kofleriaceae bacterium]